MERAMGIEPTLSAWEAEVLPLNYARAGKGILNEVSPGDKLMYSVREEAYRDRILGKVAELREYLNVQSLDPHGSPADWYHHLNKMKGILGNTNNDVSFVGTLLAKSYLVNRFGDIEFDAAQKAQGASGLDIDLTIGQERVVGEIKTTIPYNGPDFGAQQKAMFEKDFAKLAAAEAAHKYMFVTETATFEILCRPSYRERLAGVAIVQLISGEEVPA